MHFRVGPGRVDIVLWDLSLVGAYLGEMLFERVAGLELRVDGYGQARHEQVTPSGFDRVTTELSLHGRGKTGRGEDVTYEATEHEQFQESPELPPTGTYTFEAFSERLAELELFFGVEPEQSVSRAYRRWAIESAALDLALKQAETTLAGVLDRAYDPVRFVVSTRLEDPTTGEAVFNWLDHDPSLEFKLDPTPEWTADTFERLAETDAVRVLDLKGQYDGTVVDQPADRELYERVLETFPDALVEDPELNDRTRPLFERDPERVTWDYPIRSVDSVESLPWEPAWLNIKPSRFGSVRSLLETIEYCQANDIRMYGGGQFELGVGREHLHALAAVFYPDAPNDIAPRGYNEPDPGAALPASPLDPPTSPRGLEWR